MATTPCFDKNYTISSISPSILNGFACNLYNGGYIFKIILVQKCQNSLVTPNDSFVSSNSFGNNIEVNSLGNIFESLHFNYGKYVFFNFFLVDSKE